MTNKFQVVRNLIQNSDGKWVEGNIQALAKFLQNHQGDFVKDPNPECKRYSLYDIEGKKIGQNDAGNLIVTEDYTIFDAISFSNKVYTEKTSLPVIGYEIALALMHQAYTQGGFRDYQRQYRTPKDKILNFTGPMKSPVQPLRDQASFDLGFVTEYSGIYEGFSEIGGGIVNFGAGIEVLGRNSEILGQNNVLALHNKVFHAKVPELPFEPYPDYSLDHFLMSPRNEKSLQAGIQFAKDLKPLPTKPKYAPHLPRGHTRVDR